MFRIGLRILELNGRKKPLEHKENVIKVLHERYRFILIIYTV